jgi:phosphohistidine phosphatase
MRTLTIFRHAKSGWDDPALADFDRALAPRGIGDAPRMGDAMRAAWSRQTAGIPDLVLCSAAVRTRQTFALAFPDWVPAAGEAHGDDAGRAARAGTRDGAEAGPAMSARLGSAGAARGPAVAYDRALYHAPWTTLLDRLNAVPDGVRHVLLVGHNPGLHDLALELTGSGSSAERKALAVKLPTAAIVILTFPVARFADIAPDMGRLEVFLTPRHVGDGDRGR